MASPLGDRTPGPVGRASSLEERGRWLYERVPTLLTCVARRYPTAAVAVLGASTALEVSSYARIGEVVGMRLLELDRAHDLENAPDEVLCDALDPSGSVRAAWLRDPDERLAATVRAEILAFFERFCE